MWRFYNLKAREVIISENDIFDKSINFYPPKVNTPPASPSVSFATTTPPIVTVYLSNGPDKGEVSSPIVYISEPNPVHCPVILSPCLISPPAAPR